LGIALEINFPFVKTPKSFIVMSQTLPSCKVLG